MEGGAGLYIQDIISDLNSFSNIAVGGKYSIAYEGKKVQCNLINQIGKLSLPLYEGVKLKAVAYNITKSLFRLLYILIQYLSSKKRFQPELIILTSSIQALAIPIIRRIFPSTRIVLLVQENLILTRKSRGVMKWLLLQADRVISISKTWSSHASKEGLETTLLRNRYKPTFVQSAPEIEDKHVSDLLYVGGGATIKGFQLLVQALALIDDKRSLRVSLLGKYNNFQLKQLEQLSVNFSSNSHINIVGFVSDIRPFLKGTSLLLLPIEHAHFCRPAIEAGLLDKTFVISRLKGLEDFVHNKKNCLCFKSGDANDLVSKIYKILDDPELRLRLESENRKNSNSFLSIAGEATKAITTPISTGLINS